VVTPHQRPLARHPDRSALRQHLLCWRRLQESSSEDILETVQAILIEELHELGRLDFGELLVDATFIRAKKGGWRSAKPRLARV
jgi:hypothetical protein